MLACLFMNLFTLESFEAGRWRAGVVEREGEANAAGGTRTAAEESGKPDCIGCYRTTEETENRCMSHFVSMLYVAV